MQGFTRGLALIGSLVALLPAGVAARRRVVGNITRGPNTALINSTRTAAKSRFLARNTSNTSDTSTCDDFCQWVYQEMGKDEACGPHYRGCDTCDFCKPSEPAIKVEKPTFIEVGSLAFHKFGQDPQFFRFKGGFEEVPVVFATANAVGDHPVEVRISDVTLEGFTAVLAEPKGHDGPHAPQTLPFVAVAPGVHKIPGTDATVEAGFIETKTQIFGNRCKQNGLSKGWDTVAFQHDFKGTPAFITGLQTKANEKKDVPHTYSSPWLSVATNAVNKKTAQVSLERLETSKFQDVTKNEKIGWVAMDQGTGKFEAKSTDFEKNPPMDIVYASLLSRRVARGWKTAALVPFGVSMGMDSPAVVASQSSRYGGDGGWVRVLSVDKMGVTLSVDEDSACDKERSHTKEKISVMAFSGHFIV